MPNVNEDKAVSQTEEMRNFFSWAYWIVGGFCFYWETIVLVALARPEQELELPLLGKCGSGEAIIFTLTFFWPVLLVAHLLVYGHQSVAGTKKFFTQFPGVLGEKELPPTLSSLRIVLFAVLIVWPTVVHTILAVRSFTQMGIALKDGTEVHIRKDAPFIKDTDGHDVGNYVWYRGSALFGSLELPPELANEKHPDWRWLHWRDANPPEEKTVVEVRLLDGKGNELAQAPTAPDPKSDGKKEPEKLHPKHWPTALPVWQPRWNVASAAFFCGSVLWMLLLRPLWNAIPPGSLSGARSPKTKKDHKPEAQVEGAE
jgi:hypothetical protein